eukprot:6117670-Ditylum_brightwellii.AAC.1
MVGVVFQHSQTSDGRPHLESKGYVDVIVLHEEHSRSCTKANGEVSGEEQSAHRGSAGDTF